jgi:hypothetical protein
MRQNTRDFVGNFIDSLRNGESWLIIAMNRKEAETSRCESHISTRLAFGAIDSPPSAGAATVRPVSSHTP